MSSQLLVPETLEIKRTTRDQSSMSSVVLTSWCELRTPGGTILRHIFSFLTHYGPPSCSSPLGCLENLPFMCCIAPIPWGCWPFLWWEDASCLIRSSFSSTSKSLALQTYLLPFSTLFENTFSASFGASFMTLPIGNLQLKRGSKKSWVMKIVKIVSQEHRGWGESG